MAVVAVVGQLACEAMAVAAKATALPKRDRSGSSAAVDRFLQDSRRRSCSFVNLSPTALQELTEKARRHQLVLTSCVEQNVGTLARLAWPNRAIDAPAAVVPREPVCPRCAHRGKQGGHTESTDPASWRAAPPRLCAACSQPASPPSVISSASVMRQPSAPEAPPLRGAAESPHALPSSLPSALLADGHRPAPPRTTLRVATGRAYDVYDVQLPDAPGAPPGSSPTEPAIPLVAGTLREAGGSSCARLASPTPRRAAAGMAAGTAGGMPSPSSAVSFASSVSFAPRSETVGTPTPIPPLS